MQPKSAKYLASAVILILVVAALPFIGLTERTADERQGVVIDFGYWEASWTDMSFSSDMDAVDALEDACTARGYAAPVYLSDGSVYSVNDQSNLPNATWKLFLLRGSGWEESPSSADISDEKVICWARAADAGSTIPGTDATGHTYYSYASDGKSTVTGEELCIVSLAPSVTEILASVGGAGMIIGTDNYSNYPQSVSDGRADGRIKSVGGYIDPNYERILSMSPDLVFCDGSVGEHVSMADRLRKSGIDCVVLYGGTDISTLYDNIWIAASALGMSQNANSVISSVRNTVTDVSGIAGSTGKRIFVSLSADPSPWTSGSDTFMSDVVASVGGVNVFDSQSSSWFMVSKEQIYMKQPDVIVIIYEHKDLNTKDDYDRIVGSLDPLWKDTPAYDNGDIYIFSGSAADVLSRAGPRLSVAAELMAKILNPQAFEEKDSQDIIPKYFGDDYHHYLRYQGEAS